MRTWPLQICTAIWASGTCLLAFGAQKGKSLWPQGMQRLLPSVGTDAWVDERVLGEGVRSSDEQGANHHVWE